MVESPRFWAFLSYSHADRRFANWLFRALETYRMPSAIVGEEGRDGEKVPRRLTPIFRDRDELSASSDLGDKLRGALSRSRNLVVLCSPASANSHWTNQEIIEFKKMHGAKHIFAAIIGGEPGASAMPGREEEECFPPALRFQIDEDGNLTDQPAEPIAADFRTEGDGKKLAKLKLISGMLGVPLDSLVQRDAARRNKRFAWLAAASAAGMALTTTLAVTAYQARNEAIFQRGEAAGLVEFMLTDLREKLEPVGRLDTLDAVGERALAYYEKQKLDSLSEEELAQRATALTLVGEVRNLEGDLEGALEAFSEAARTTEEQLRRHPDDPERYYNHSQSSFWVGAIAWQRGDNDTARRYFSDYLAMADQMVELEPENDTYAFEKASAHINLGVLDQQEVNHQTAAANFGKAEAILIDLGAQDAANRDLAFTLAQSYAWSASSLQAIGDVASALAKRRAEVALYDALFKNDPEDFQPLGSRLFAGTEIASILLESGRVEEAARAISDIEPLVDQLLARDASNTLWQDFAGSFFNQHSEIALARSRLSEARSANRRAMAICESLGRADSDVENWRYDCLARALFQKSIIAHRQGDRVAATAARARFSREFADPESQTKFNVLIGEAMIRLALEGQPESSELLAKLDRHDRQDDSRLTSIRTLIETGSQPTNGYPAKLVIGG